MNRCVGLIFGWGFVLALCMAESGRPSPQGTSAPCPGLESQGPKAALFLPGLVSGPGQDLVARFQPGGREFYLMRWNAETDATTIIRFLCRGDRWVDAGPAPIPFAGTIAYPCFSPDGNELYFDGAEGQGMPDIWRASRRGDGWGPATRLGPEINSPAVEMLSCVAANGDIYFSSNRPGGLGSFDIYVARKTAGGYKPAENLGPAVNTVEFESHPFVAPDGSYLLFDSRRKGGLGSNDIYLSFRNAEGGWTPAHNIGPEINTAAGDMRPYVAPGGRALYFCSDRNGTQDIWLIDAAVIEKIRRDVRPDPTT